MYKKDKKTLDIVYYLRYNGIMRMRETIKKLKRCWWVTGTLMVVTMTITDIIIIMVALNG